MSHLDGETRAPEVAALVGTIVRRHRIQLSDGMLARYLQGLSVVVCASILSMLRNLTLCAITDALHPR